VLASRRIAPRSASARRLAGSAPAVNTAAVGDLAPALHLAQKESSRARRPRERFATASVVSSRLADDCYASAMHKPGRLLPAYAALLLIYGIDWSLGPGAIVRARPSA